MFLRALFSTKIQIITLFILYLGAYFFNFRFLYHANANFSIVETASLIVLSGKLIMNGKSYDLETKNVSLYTSKVCSCPIIVT